MTPNSLHFLTLGMLFGVVVACLFGLALVYF
jgi:hypothetical protein